MHLPRSPLLLSGGSSQAIYSRGLTISKRLLSLFIQVKYRILITLTASVLFAHSSDALSIPGADGSDGALNVTADTPSSAIRGFFLLPELPNDEGETISNTPVRSGGLKASPAQ